MTKNYLSKNTNKPRRDIHFYANDDRYEYLMREAKEFPVYLQSMQHVIDEKLFGKDMEKRLDSLRKKHRKLNIPDKLFLHPKLLESMGEKDIKFFKKTRRKQFYHGQS